MEVKFVKNKFSKKLLALFLAVVMSLTAFSGALTAFAASDSPYHDDSLTSDQVNSLGWVELTDDQTAEALLDYLDSVLADLAIPVNLNVNIVITSLNLSGTIDSVSGLLDVIAQLDDFLDGNSTLLGMAGDAKNINLNDIADLSYSSATGSYPACGKDYRASNSAKDIVKALFTTIYRNTANWDNSHALFKQVLTGQLNLGTIVQDWVGVDIWQLLNDNLFSSLFGEPLPSGYQDNLVFHIVAKLITSKTDWFNEEEANHIYNGDAGYELDNVLFQALSENLLQQINVQVTYPDGTNSRDLYEQGITDPNLCYTDDGNVYIFQYDENEDGTDDANLTLTATSNLSDFAYEAFEIAWKTVLSPTIKLINSAVKNYDWDYTEWYLAQGKTWNYADVEANYSATDVERWASEFGLDLEQVKQDLTYDRNVIADAAYNWRDIDSTKLFNELRRSPLMVYYFKAETGPLNTNFKCTGTPNIDQFMSEQYANYDSLLGGLNDFLVAAVKDFLPEFDAGSLTVTGNDSTPSVVATTLVNNALKVVQYIADATDKNILSAFYHNNGDGIPLTEANFEEAMVPFLIACLENNLDGLLGQIHKDKWDACNDAEGVAAVALEEYLSDILPHLDYSSMIAKDESGYYNVDLDTILAMCRDAVGYVMTQYVPVEDGNGNAWSIYDVDTAQTYQQQLDTKTDIFTLLNSVIVYYANDKGAASLLGIIDDNNTCLITNQNTIWQNIDLIANSILPVLGELQFSDSSKAGQFDSEDLIWNDIVSGVLDIGDTSNHEETGAGGITNFIYKFASIINAPSITTKAVDLVAYDLVKDLINSVLDSRYSNSHYIGQHVIPDATTNHPFHDVIQRDVLGGKVGDDSDIGIFGKFVVNLCEAAGCNGYPESIWDGAMFAVQAVASFVPAFAPQLQDYEVGDLDVAQDNSATSSYSYNEQFTFNMSLENLGHGINRYIQNGSGGYDQLSRSYIKIESINADKGSFNYGNYDSLLAPEKSTSFMVSGSVDQAAFGGSNEAIVTFSVNYRIVEKDGNTPYGGYGSIYDQTFTKKLYYYLTTVNDWYNLTYDPSSGSGFTQQFSAGYDPASGTYSSMTYRVVEDGVIFKDYGNVQYPNEMIIRTSDLDNINYPLYLYNETSGKGIDGIAAVKSFGDGEYFAVTCDPATGDLVNVFYYDYYQNGQWVTNSPLNRTDMMNLMESDITVTDYRFHVVCPYEQIDTFTFADGYAPGKHQAEMAEDGSYSIIWLPIDSGNYKSVLDYSRTQSGDVSLSSCIPGLVLAFNKIETNGSSQRMDFLVWDQETQVTAGTTKGRDDFGYRIISSFPQTFAMPITVANDTGEIERATSLYETSVEFLNNYTSSDVDDINVYNYFNDAVMEVLAAQQYPITTDNALEYGTTKANNTVYTSTTNPIGDVAYKVASASELDGDTFAPLRVEAYLDNGTYYMTRYEDSTGVAVYDNPIFTNVKATPGNGLTETEETVRLNISGTAQDYTVYSLDGTDLKAIYVREPGVDAEAQYHLLNAVQYEKEWIDLGSGSGELLETPYYVDSDVQASDAAGNLYYNEISFTYRDTANVSTSSTDPDWRFKFAETSYGIVDDPALRGAISSASDKAEYALQLVNEHLNVSYGTDVYENVAVVRSGLDNRDFEVVSYENMAAAGRAAEALITVDYFNNYYIDVDGEPQLAFSCLASEAEDELASYNATNETEYELSDFVTETVEESSVASSSATTFELREAQRLFDTYLAVVTERGYIGDKLEEEISCAVNGKSSENKDYTGTSYTSVIVNTEEDSYTVDGATYTADNNPDGVTYTEGSWHNFIVALDNAVNAAVEGNSSYPYAASGIYQPANKDQYTLQVSDVYGYKIALMRAENELTVAGAVEPEGYTVSAYVGALTTSDAEFGTYATTGATVSIQTEDGTQISAVTDDTGKFVLENVPNGAYEATITYKYGFTRTFTIIVNGADVESTTMVGIVACNWDGINSNITTSDMSAYALCINASVGSDNYDLGIDIDRSGAITASDMAVCAGFINYSASQIEYADTTIQN